MKTMKRYSAIASLLLMAGVMVAACSTQELEIPSEVEENASGHMLFTATLAAKNPVTKAVDADGKTTWVVDEKIAVYYEKNDNSYGKATANVDAVDEGKAKISALLEGAKDGGMVKFVFPASIVNETGDDIDEIVKGLT